MIAAKITFEFAVIMFVMVALVYSLKIILAGRKKIINTRIQGKE